MNDLVSECHKAQMTVMGGAEGTNHYQCNECGQACNWVEVSDPASPSNADLREAITEIIVSIIQLPRGKTVSQDYYADEIMQKFQAREQQLLAELLGELPLQYDNYTDTNMEDYQNGHNAAVDQVVSAIERLQNKTNDGGRDG